MWVLIDDGVVSRFGPALALADSRGAASLEVLVEEAVPGAASVIARRAAEMASPAGVWWLSGREVQRAEPAPADPESAGLASAGGDVAEPAQEPVGLGGDSSLAALLIAHGAEPVFEHGVLRGEVLGLEVARVIGGELVVGVGRHDRNARLEMRPGEDAGAALDEAVAAVRARRRFGAARHPANTLARSRWLRVVVCARPPLVGASSLSVVAPPLPWFDLPEAGAAPCVGSLADGSPAVVVCSVGVDLDLVPTAADCRALYRPGARLLVVVPEGDDVPVTRRLAAALARPAEIVTVRRDWESLLDGGP
jgi:hypothetical protein